MVANDMTLLPTSPLFWRYSKDCEFDPPQFSSIPEGCTERRIEPLPEGWSSFIHPEGKRYYVQRHTKFNVIVEVNIRDAQIKNTVLSWVKRVEDLVVARQVPIPCTGLELYLAPHESEESERCSYYFASLSTQTVFWLETVETDTVGMEMAVSQTHSCIGLERLFWIHTEYFPCHAADQVSHSVLDDLISILSHGQADHLTSRTSTFPYTAHVCEQHLRLLRPLAGKPFNGYSLCITARLMAAVAYTRFMTHYGEENAQLDRLQQVTPRNTAEYPLVTSIANLIMWNVPRLYLTQLEEVYINDLVHQQHWVPFISSCLRDWSTSLSWTFPILIAALVLSAVSGTSLAGAMPSIMSCTASIATGSILYSRHKPMANATASTAAEYLYAARSSSALGFLPTAVVFSMPRAFYFWGLCFFVANILLSVSYVVEMWIVLLAGISLTTLISVVLRVSSPEEESVGYRLFKRLASLRLTMPFSTPFHQHVEVEEQREPPPCYSVGSVV